MLAVSLCLLVAAAKPDAEPPKEKARGLVSTANELYAKGEYPAALALYQRAFDVHPNPMILYNIARAHQQIGDVLRAAEHYEKYLAESGAAPGSERYELAVAELEELERSIGRLVIRGAPEDAEVLVDGKAPAASSVRVLPGEHEITASLLRHVPFRRRVLVEGGRTITVEVELIEETAPITAPIAIAPLPEPESAPVTEQWWFWSLIALGAAVAAGATAGVLLTREDFSRSGELDTSRTSEWETF
jgi:tetratricopeptide (TPR) repeat protein